MKLVPLHVDVMYASSCSLAIRYMSKVKPNKVRDEIPVLELRAVGTSPATWDHTVLPATRHK